MRLRPCTSEVPRWVAYLLLQQWETMVTEDLFGVESSCDKFLVSLPREDAFSAFKGGDGSYYSMERPFKVFVWIRHGQCSSPVAGSSWREWESAGR
jgi:hypothetical protein